MMAWVWLAVQALSLSTPNGGRPTQEKLNVLSDRCSTSHGWLRHGEGKSVILQAPPGAKLEQIECVLGQLKGSSLDFELSFIGNAPASEKK